MRFSATSHRVYPIGSLDRFRVVPSCPTFVVPPLWAILRMSIWRNTMAKKKAAVKKNTESLTKSRNQKKKVKSRNVLPKDSSAYVVLTDAVASQNGPFFPLIVSLNATAQNCRGDAVDLSNFEFGTLARSTGPFPIEVNVPGIILNPGSNSSEIKFEIPSWATGGIGTRQEELIITVTTKKKVGLTRRN